MADKYKPIEFPMKEKYVRNRYLISYTLAKTGKSTMTKDEAMMIRIKRKHTYGISLLSYLGW